MIITRFDHQQLFGMCKYSTNNKEILKIHFAICFFNFIDYSCKPLKSHWLGITAD